MSQLIQMDANNDVLFSEIPAGLDLYHYSSQAGLLGIAQSQSLWFSHVKFQNDSQEYSYALNLVKKITKELYHKDLYHAFNSLEPYPPPIFSFSLSEQKDSLSQWRGYCPDGGFSFSFRPEVLNEAMKNNEIVIGQCQYEIEAQKKFIIDNIMRITPEEYKSQRELLETYQSNRNSFPPETVYALEKTLYLMTFNIKNRTSVYGILLKHPAFKDEEEWRLILNKTKALHTRANTNPGTLSGVYENTRFKQGKSYIIPYESIGLKFNPLPGPFSQIIVGPNPDEKLALEATKIFIKEGCRVINSKIPYRNW